MLENKDQTYNEEKEVDTYSQESLELLPFNSDYQCKMDERNLDTLMYISELEEAFEKDWHHKLSRNGYKHLTAPLIECHEYFTGGHGTKATPISPQSKRRRVSSDGDLEQPQLLRNDQESAGFDPLTATSIVASTTMDKDPDQDSQLLSDVDLSVDSEDEVSLIRTATPSDGHISLSVTKRRGQPTVKYPATGLTTASNMQAADALPLSISQFPQGSVDFSSTERTLPLTNTVSQGWHSDPSAEFSAGSLSLRGFAVMSPSSNLGNDMSTAAPDNFTSGSSPSAVNLEDVVMTDQFNDSQVASVPEIESVSITHEPRSASFIVDRDEQPWLSSQNTSGYYLAHKDSATDIAAPSVPMISEQRIIPEPNPNDRITGPNSPVDTHSANIVTICSSDDGNPLSSSALPAADIPALRDADLESTPTEAQVQSQIQRFSPPTQTSQTPKLVSPSLFSLSGFQITSNTKTCPFCNKTYKHHGYLVNHIRQCHCKAPVTVPPTHIPSSAEESPDPGNYTCTKCGKSYRKRGNFENHEVKCNATTHTQQIQSVKQLPSISETYTGSVVLPDREMSDKMGRPVCTACNTVVSSRKWLYRHIDNTCKVLRAQGVYSNANQVQNILRSSQTPEGSNQSQSSSKQLFSSGHPLSPAAFASRNTESVVFKRNMSGSMPLTANISATYKGSFNLNASIQDPSTSPLNGSYVSHSGNQMSRPSADTMPHPGTGNGLKSSTMASFSFVDNDTTKDVDAPDSHDVDEDEVSIRQEYSASPTPAGKEKGDRDFSSLSTRRHLYSTSGRRGSELLEQGPGSIEKILASSDQPIARDLNDSLLGLGLSPGVNKTQCLPNSHRRRLFTDRIRSNPHPLDGISDPFKDSPLGKPRDRWLDFDAPSGAKMLSPSSPIDRPNVPAPIKSSPLRLPTDAQLTIIFPHARSLNSNLKLFEKFIDDAGADSLIEMSCPDERILFLKAPKGTDLATVARDLLPNKLVAEGRCVLRFDPAAARRGKGENEEREDIPQNNIRKETRTNIVEKEEKSALVPVKGRGRGWNLKKNK